MGTGIMLRVESVWVDEMCVGAAKLFGPFIHQIAESTDRTFAERYLAAPLQTSLAEDMRIAYAKGIVDSKLFAVEHADIHVIIIIQTVPTILGECDGIVKISVLTG